MPLYHKLGKIPPKRHTVFKKTDGSLHYEQLFGTIGFEGMSSLLYHLYRPTMVKEVGATKDVAPKAAVRYNIKSRLLKGFEIRPEDDFLESRKIVLFNSDVNVALAAPRKAMAEYFYKNADADELLFIHKGTGTLKTFLGEIPFEYGDYLLIPFWSQNHSALSIRLNGIAIGSGNIWNMRHFVSAILNCPKICRPMMRKGSL